MNLDYTTAQYRSTVEVKIKKKDDEVQTEQSHSDCREGQALTELAAQRETWSARTVTREKWRQSNTSSSAAPTMRTLEGLFILKFEILCFNFIKLNNKRLFQHLLG